MRASGAEDALDKLAKLAGDFDGALVQGYVAGRGAGAYLFRWNGKILARTMHLRLHECPHTGGASSYRKTFWHDAMMADAEAKLAALDWQGVAMVEYRWDENSDRFSLIEINLRFWGSLHLDLYAGVDFPRLLADAFLFGEYPETMVEGRQGVFCRNTIPSEIGYLFSLWRDDQVEWGTKVGAGLEAVALQLNPFVHDDLFYPGDRMLFFDQLSDFLSGRGG